MKNLILCNKKTIKPALLYSRTARHDFLPVVCVFFFNLSIVVLGAIYEPVARLASMTDDRLYFCVCATQSLLEVPVGIKALRTFADVVLHIIILI